MATTKKNIKAAKTKATSRTSVTLPTELYGTLNRIAAEQKVSVSWVIRDAAEKYVADRWPLLSREA